MPMDDDEVITLASDLRAAATAMNNRYKQTADKVDGLSARFDEWEQRSVRRGSGDENSYSSATSLGAAVTRHNNFGEVQNLADQRGKVTITGLKAMITTSPTSGGALVPPDVRVDPVMLLRRRLTVRDLVQKSTTSASSVSYAKQTVRTLDARVVSEGATKPESTIAFELETAPVRTIATWGKISRQSLSDAPVLRSLLDSDLSYGVKLAEESELLLGDGSGMHLHGIIPQAEAFAPAFTADAPTDFDVLQAALAQANAALLPSDGIVLNETDLDRMRLIKDGEGRYIGGGPFGPPITSIWGKPVVGTPAMASGNFLVGAFSTAATLYDREEINLLISTENEDDFIRNLCTALVEERLAFAVRRPQAFVYGELLSASG